MAKKQKEDLPEWGLFIAYKVVERICKQEKPLPECYKSSGIPSGIMLLADVLIRTRIRLDIEEDGILFDDIKIEYKVKQIEKTEIIGRKWWAKNLSGEHVFRRWVETEIDKNIFNSTLSSQVQCFITGGYTEMIDDLENRMASDIFLARSEYCEGIEEVDTEINVLEQIYQQALKTKDSRTTSKEDLVVKAVVQNIQTAGVKLSSTGRAYQRSAASIFEEYGEFFTKINETVEPKINELNLESLKWLINMLRVNVKNFREEVESVLHIIMAKRWGDFYSDVKSDLGNDFFKTVVARIAERERNANYNKKYSDLSIIKRSEYSRDDQLHIFRLFRKIKESTEQESFLNAISMLEKQHDKRVAYFRQEQGFEVTSFQFIYRDREYELVDGQGSKHACSLPGKTSLRVFGG